MTKELKRPTSKEAVSGETPLCIRFKPGDLDRVLEAASRNGILRSVWIREAALERADQVMNGLKVETLTYETAGGVGDQVCIRFRPRDFERIKRAASREKALPSPWIRAVVMHRVDQMGITKSRKSAPHAARVKNGAEHKTG